MSEAPAERVARFADECEAEGPDGQGRPCMVCEAYDECDRRRRVKEQNERLASRLLCQVMDCVLAGKRELAKELHERAIRLAPHIVEPIDWEAAYDE